MLFQDRVAIVTGGSRGIGKAIARTFLENGAAVAICSRTERELRTTAQELRGIKDVADRVIAVRADVAQRSDVQQVIQEVVKAWGRVDILVNNAGIAGMNPIDKEDNRRWFATIETNLTGMFLVSKEALRYMKDGTGGRIINISSVLGKFGVAGYTAYCAAKHGVIGFTRALALEVAHRGITVNAICPGWVDTEMARAGIEEGAAFLGISPEELKKQAISHIPIKRFLQPSEVAGLVLFLASDAASGITGQAINICGGEITA